MPPAPPRAAALPRRILMTADAVGGVWDYAIELCRGLAATGIEVVLAVLGPPPAEDQRADAACVPGLTLVHGAYRLEWMEDPWSDVAASGDWLLDLEARHGCDLVHLGGYAHGALPFRSPKLVVGHSCVRSWWRAVKGESAPASWDAYTRAVTAGLAAADQVVAPTRFMLDALDREYGLPRGGEVIPNGRDPGRYRAGDKRPVVLCAGRLWDEAKNARALAAVAGRLPWQVRIAGATRPADRPARDADLPAAPNLALLGRMASADLAREYAAAAVYALPARYEPFGLTALEAALSGCALVLGDIPSLRELWDGAARFVPADDPEALVAALTALIADPTARVHAAAAARRHAHRYLAAPMVARYLDLYARLRLQGPAPTPPSPASPSHKEPSPACAS